MASPQIPADSGRNQAPPHERLIRALRPYGDDSTSVGDALHRAEAERGFVAWAERVAATAEARTEAPGG